MPYIGTQPLTGQFKKLDAITVVNGQAAYTMNYNSAAYKPATANALLVSVNGVIQAAEDAYTISGSTITFTENLVTGDTIDFIIALGDTGSAVTPVDGSVTTAKLANDAVTSDKLAHDLTVQTSLSVPTIKDSSGTNTAMTINSSGLVLGKSLLFQVQASDTDQSISADTNTVAQWESVEIDTGSYWDSTNNRYTPQVAGWYLFGGTFRFLTAAGQYVAAYLRKNGSGLTQVQLNTGSGSTNIFSNGGLPIPTTMVQMNGSTDYVDVSFAAENAVTLHDSSSTRSFFWGMLVHKT